MPGRVLVLLAAILVAGCETSPSGGPTPLPVEKPKLGYGTEPGPDDPDAQKEFTTTQSGLKFRILRKGSDKKPTINSRVDAAYKGWLEKDGKEFDNSYKKSGRPVEFRVDGVIKGWTEGVQLIGEGGKIELIVPPDLGYGDKDTQHIPANSTLHFIIELAEVRP